ncbi:MAG: class I tRNA ligase family protein, partial [Patescibacteria group bacterium]
FGIVYEPLLEIPAIEKTGKKAWYITDADFVTTEEGTGVVHTAVVYGEDDYNLGLKKDLPVMPLLDEKGIFNADAPELIRGQYFKKSEGVIKEYLETKGLLFAKQNHTHSYPHCWRCDTQLFYNAISAWFINIQKIKPRLIKLNEKINWYPDNLKHGRFLNILETAPDWNISRNRYWATPLPFWKCDKCQKTKVLGSVEELRAVAPGKITKLILVRHGESLKNIQHIFDSGQDSSFVLDKTGIKEAKAAAKKIAKETGELVIYASPIVRTKQTAEIIAKKLGLEITFAPELEDIHNGNWDGRVWNDPAIADSRQAYKTLAPAEQYLAKRGQTGETWQEAEARITDFVKAIALKEAGKTIILVSHQGPMIYLVKALRNLGVEETVKLFDLPAWQAYAEPISVYIDHKTGKELDMHKQFVDEVKFPCPCGGMMARIPEVIDCWVESASMPFAEHHYPFENEAVFRQRFPGQYIAEYIAQTRAWFYYMHVMSTLLFNDISFQNCVCTGTILNDKGEKLSKSKRNFTDPWEIINLYGVDALRYYLMSGVVMQAENLFFNDREVKDVYNKVINILNNILSFYQTFSAGTEVTNLEKSDLTNVLDLWITSKLELLKKEVTDAMDNYNVVKASRPIKDFIDELSTWYVRRSRDRFKSEDSAEKLKALKTLRHTLINLAKLMAPFTPYIAEHLWQELKATPESVHLATWPKSEPEFFNEKVLSQMEVTRKIVEAGLAARAAAGVKIRQPLTCYTTPLGQELTMQYGDIIKDELNVLMLKSGSDSLDTVLTPELKEQGLYRELTRAINALRKDAGLTIQDRVTIYYQTASYEIAAVFAKFKADLQKDTLAAAILNQKPELPAEHQTEANINGVTVWIGLKK